MFYRKLVYAELKCMTTITQNAEGVNEVKVLLSPIIVYYREVKILFYINSV